MRLMNCTVLFLVACGIAEAQVQSREATNAEIELIREAFGLDGLPGWRQLEVLEVLGSFRPLFGGSGSELHGTVYMQPYEVQGSLCVLEGWFNRGVWSNGAYEWQRLSTSYWNWLHDADGDCRISDRSSVPESAVVTRQAIPSPSLLAVLSNADEILALAYEFAAGAVEIEARDRSRFLAFRDEPTYRLREVGITMESLPGIGFAFTANYRSARKSEGPVMSFSIGPTGIVIHSVGFWIA